MYNLFAKGLLAAACLFVPVSAYAAIPQQERDALIALYNSTGGANWTAKTGWLGSAGTECQWYGVTCDANQNYVQSLSLTGNRLSGAIPAELGNLANLQSLNLNSNRLIGGAIPAELGNLANLQSLDLSYNQLSGTMPAQLGSLTNLQILYLNANNLSGVVPPELGSLTNLQRLNLHDNHLTGPIPARLGSLANLGFLFLSYNQLTGTIPLELDSLTNLQWLDLSFNRLTGTIPARLGNLANLELLDLSNNQLSGTIPAQLGNLTNLKHWLGLRNNQLTGTIPPELGNLTNLLRLWLDHNQLSGTIPAQLSSLTSLFELDLSFNQLSGTIPVQLGDLTNLQLFYLNSNQLSGSIPAQFGKLTNLDTLDLSHNQLSGTIPVQLGSLARFYSLDLSSNHLTGTIPAQFGNLSNLRTLDLSSNQLSGAIPAQLGSLKYYLLRPNLNWNALYTSDSNLLWLLGSGIPGWQNTQTVAPSNVTANPQSESALVTWTPISFTSYSGRYEVWSSTTSGGPYSLSGSTPDKSSTSLTLTGLTPGTTYYLVVRTVTDPHEYNQNKVVSEYTPQISVSIGQLSLDFLINSGGAATAVTIGSDGPTLAGYAEVRVNSGSAPYGTAVFSFKQNGVTISEAGVPASPPTTSARIFVDYRIGATIPGSSGKVDIYTGIAAVNRGDGPATITFTLRSLDGQVITTGTGSLAKDAHIAKYFNQLPDFLSGFSIPASFPTSTHFGTLELISNQPLSILALRLTTNQRGQTLFTSTPIADSTQPLTSTPIYFPQVVDGGGYSTTVILLNTSRATESGALRLYANDGSPVTVRQVGGALGSSFSYSILAGGAYVFQTDASPAASNVGWAALTPDGGTSTPVGGGIFQYSPSDVLLTESGVPAATPTTHARIFVDTSGGHDTGLAIGNPGDVPMNITLAAYQMDGSTQTGISLGPLQLGGKGHAAAFVDQRISDLPPGFRGVLDIVGDSPFVALTIRSLINERSEFLLTTFPVADMNKPAPSPIIFPQIADGGGFTTEFILIRAGQAGSMTIRFFGDAGTPLAIGK